MARRISYLLGYIAYLYVLVAIDARFLGIASSAMATGHETAGAALFAAIAIFSIGMLFGLLWYFRRMQYVMWRWPTLKTLQQQEHAVRLAEERTNAAPLAELERGVQVAPWDVGAWVRLAYALNLARRHDDALSASQHALALDANLASAWARQASALLGLERTEEALAASEHALALDPNDPLVWANKAAALMRLGYLAAALDTVDQAAALGEQMKHPWQMSLVWQVKGLIMTRLERYQEALDSYDRAIAVLPNLAAGWYGRALCLLRLGRGRDAKEAMIRARELCK